MIDHTRANDLAAVAIDFDLTPLERDELATHMATCPACRRVADGYRRDAESLRAIAFAFPPTDIRSAVLATAARSVPRASTHWRLLAAAALLLLAIGAALAVGAWTTRPSLVVVTPSSAPSPSSVVPSPVALAFAPPTPVCSPPATEVTMPEVNVAVRGAGVVATRGSSTVTTCSTTGTDDTIPARSYQPLAVSSGDQLELTVPPGWAFLHVEGTDRPIDGQPRTDRAPIDRPDRPILVEVPAPVQVGDSVVGLTIWLVGEGGGVVGSIDVTFLVRVRADPGSSAPPTTTVVSHVDVPAAAVRTFAEDPAPLFTAAYGSNAFELVLGARSRTGGTLRMHDLLAGTTRTLGAITGTHTVYALTASVDHITWVEAWRDNPSPPTQDVPGCLDTGKPLRWQIVALTLSTGQRTTIESGTNRRMAYPGECADVDAPRVATDGDRIAFTVEAGDATHPFGNRLVVRSFAPGAELRSITTEGMVEDLQLSGEALAYRENTNATSGSLAQGAGRLVVVWSDATAPEVVYDHVGSLALGGQRIAWVRGDSTVDSIWTSIRGATEPTEVAVPADGRLFLMTMDRLAVSDDLVTWIETAQVLGSTGPGDCCAQLLTVWTPDASAARYVAGFGASERVGVSDGWLAVLTYPDPLDPIGHGSQPAGFHAMPVAALRP